MSRAILVVGGNPIFKNNAKLFHDFLKDRVGISRIEFIETAYLNRMEFLERLVEELDKATLYPGNKPILLAYFGHGNDGHWIINETTTFSYDDLAKALSEMMANILLINDCCHAHSLVSFLEKLDVSKELVGIISSSEVGYESDYLRGALAGKIIEAWSKRTEIQAHVRKSIGLCEHCGRMVLKSKPEDWSMQPVLRWGADLDHYFFNSPKLLTDTTP